MGSRLVSLPKYPIMMERLRLVSEGGYDIDNLLKDICDRLSGRRMSATEVVRELEKAIGRYCQENQLPEVWQALIPNLDDFLRVLILDSRQSLQAIAYNHLAA